MTEIVFLDELRYYFYIQTPLRFFFLSYGKAFINLKKDSAPFSAMSHLVRMVVGDWERGGQGAWKFNPDLTWPKHDLVVRKNEKYNSVVCMVRDKYRLDQLLNPAEPVLLTYEFPNAVSEPGDYTVPPIEITDDGDVEIFMSVRIDCVWLELYVTFGGRDVDRYRMQKEVEDVEAEEEDIDGNVKSLPSIGITN